MKTRRWGLIAVLATILALLMVGPTFAGGHPGDPPGLDRAIAAQEAHTNALLARPGVVGTAVGLGADGQAVVVIYAASAGVPGLPDQLDGVPVDVVVTGIILARADPKAWQSRPVPIGVSTGHPDITAGTIGARVKKGTDVFALSNNHVYAATNSASIGDSALQPGPIDGGEDPADAIGTLFDFEPIDFSGGDNTMDAAIAISSTDLLGNSTPSEGYGTPNSTTVAATLSDPPQEVQKYGRTTERTQGTVSEINVTVNVCYKLRGPLFCNPNFIAKFVDQIAISPGDFSAGGDSGSLIVTDDTNANPVGLLFAGSSTRTIANRIDLVLARFGVTVDDSAGAPSNDAPSVFITSPVDGSSFDSGATVSFAGTATDTEDGDLTASLAWTSNLDGPISTGGSFSAVLTDGDHVITASVTDSDGASGSDSVTITVGTPNSPPTVTITSPVDGSTFDSGTAISFVGSASDTEDGDLTASLVWTSDLDGPIGTGGSFSTTLSDGTHTITAEVTDSVGATGSASVSTTVGTPPTEATTVSVDSVTYATEGGKAKDKHLLITVALVDDLGSDVSGASVSVTLTRAEGGSWDGTATTGTGGTVTFSLKNAKSGTYTTTVTDVTAAGLIWDHTFPANEFVK